MVLDVNNIPGDKEGALYMQIQQTTEMNVALNNFFAIHRRPLSAQPFLLAATGGVKG